MSECPSYPSIKEFMGKVATDAYGKCGICEESVEFIDGIPRHLSDKSPVTKIAPALLETAAKPSLSPEMKDLILAVESMILWCPRGWSLELDAAMTTARAAIAKTGRN